MTTKDHSLATAWCPHVGRAAVIVDYQNVHLRGHERFCGDRPLHECLISPGVFARRLLDVRAAAGRGKAELVEVQVFRGLPEPEYDLAGYERNLAQRGEWETGPRVRVTHRPRAYRQRSKRMKLRECHFCHRIGSRQFVSYGDWSWRCQRDDLCRKRVAKRGLIGSTAKERE